MKTTINRARAGYDAANLVAAPIIAGDPARYPGLMQEWADLVLGRAVDVADVEANTLYERTAA